MTDLDYLIRSVAGEEFDEYRGSLSLSVHERAVIDRLVFKLAAAVEERDAEFASVRAAHAVEVTGLLRSMMGYLTALTVSGSDMVTFVAQKLNPYLDAEDEAPRTPKEA